MNETFEKLKLRAVREADTTHIDFDNLSHTDIQILGDAAVEKKLVELVVWEWIGCCESVISDPVRDSIYSWLESGTQCIAEIKHHFGVEE